MHKDNFGIYASRETRIFRFFLQNNRWFAREILDFKPDNTGHHDLKCRLKNKKVLIVEIKQEEARWFSKTGNLGLDYLSAFTFTRNRERWLKNNHWIKARDYDDFIKDTQIDKWGKLLTCDADVQLFYVHDHLCKMYNNAKLQDPRFVMHLNKNLSLRINRKKDYNLADTWESAAYFVPANNKYLQEAEINHVQALNTAIKDNRHNPARNY